MVTMSQKSSFLQPAPFVSRALTPDTCSGPRAFVSLLHRVRRKSSRLTRGQSGLCADFLSRDSDKRAVAYNYNTPLQPQNTFLS
jgi:hypothetical protein